VKKEKGEVAFVKKHFIGVQAALKFKTLSLHPLFLQHILTMENASSD
jgi:hypothetical protein